MVASVRRCQKHSPFPTEPIPGDAKPDVPLAKAGPSINDGNASVIT